MRTVTYDPSSDTFQLKSVVDPKPDIGEVLIQVDACGLNPVDAKIDQWYQHAAGLMEKDSH